MKLKDFNWIYELALSSITNLIETYKPELENKDWNKGYDSGIIAGKTHVLRNIIPYIENITKHERREIELELEAILHGNKIQKIRDKKQINFCEMHKPSGCEECPNRWICQKQIQRS